MLAITLLLLSDTKGIWIAIISSDNQIIGTGGCPGRNSELKDHLLGIDKTLITITTFSQNEQIFKDVCLKRRVYRKNDKKRR